ncbi:MAG: phosphatase PAP2 family protein [Gemmataceae bacterium]
MPDDLDYGRLTQRSLIALFVCAVLVTTCYFYVDRAVAWFVFDNDFSRFRVLRWLTEIPPILQSWAPAVIVAVAIRRAWGPLRRWECVVLASGVGMVLADQFRETLSYVFGRYWPQTWIDNNPSLIRDQAYGFHFFHGGIAYGSFPSGHTARTVGILAPIWMAYARLRWICALALLAEVAGLLGMNYHFVGDTVGGGFVGGIVGAYTAYACGVVRPPVHPNRFRKSISEDT